MLLHILLINCLTIHIFIGDSILTKLISVFYQISTFRIQKLNWFSWKRPVSKDLWLAKISYLVKLEQYLYQSNTSVIAGQKFPHGIVRQLQFFHARTPHTTGCVSCLGIHWLRQGACDNSLDYMLGIQLLCTDSEYTRLVVFKK